MSNNKLDDIKKAMFMVGGVLATWAVYTTFMKTPKVKAAGDDPPRSLFMQNIPWATSKGPIGSKGYTQLIEEYFQDQNQKSFCVRAPGFHPILRTVDPRVIKETFSCPYSWIKNPE